VHFSERFAPRYKADKGKQILLYTLAKLQSNYREISMEWEVDIMGGKRLIIPKAFKRY